MKRWLTLSIPVVLLLGLCATWAGVSFALEIPPAEAASGGDTGPTGQKTCEQSTLPLAMALPEFQSYPAGEDGTLEGERSSLDITLRLISVFLLVALNAFFVAAEFSLVSVRPTRVEELIAQGNRTAVVVGRAIATPIASLRPPNWALPSPASGWAGSVSPPCPACWCPC